MDNIEKVNESTVYRILNGSLNLTDGYEIMREEGKYIRKMYSSKNLLFVASDDC